MTARVLLLIAVFALLALACPTTAQTVCGGLVERGSTEVSSSSSVDSVSSV